MEQEAEGNRRAGALGYLNVLPDELICDILELLAARDLAILSCVSSVFYIFCNEEPLWMKLCSCTHDGLLKYAGSWKKTVLESPSFRVTHVTESGHEISNSKLHFDGFSSLFLYRRWYRCNVNLSCFGVDCQMIDRRHGLSLEYFVSNYDGKKPLLLDGLADGWPAMQNWSIDYLVKHYGQCVFKVAQNSDKKMLMCFQDYALYMMQQHDEDPLYIFDPKFGEAAPGLVKDYHVPTLFKEDLFSFMDDSDRPPFRWLVIGPTRSGASWHVDPALTSAWNTLIRGRKRWALYPPGRVPPSVVVHADEEDGEVDVDSPSSLQWWLEIYPALKDEDKPLECIQGPGETIFVPSGWWHCVLNLEDSVAVTQNFVNTTNLELVCLDLTPGYHHKAVARAGRLALQEHASAVANLESKEADKANKLGSFQSDWNFSVDFLVSFVDHETNHVISNSVRSDFFLSQSLRKWLRNLWLSRQDLRQQIWKGACIAFDAKGLLDRVFSVCHAHNLPFPTEDEQLPLGNGSNPVFFVGSNVIKLCLDDAIVDRALDGVASELQFYAVLRKSGSPLRRVIPELVASGIVYFDNGSYRAVSWDGKSVPQRKLDKRRRKKSLRSGEYHRARWNQAVLNPSYLEWCEDDIQETRSMNCPYIVTTRCDGEDFAHMRERLQESHILELANILGKHLYNLHSLPLPSICSMKNGAHKPLEPELQQLMETNGNIAVIQQKDTFCQIPKEWTLFISMMRRQRIHTRSRLQEWECVPAHLITQAEDYLPTDPAVLAGLSKVTPVEAEIVQPVWLHMDVTEENIQVVLSAPGEGMHPTEHSHKNGSLEDIRTCYILDFGDVSLGDPLYELIGIYLDVFRGNTKFLKCFLASYKHSPSPKGSCLSMQVNGWSMEPSLELPYRAMCYTILHEENALGAVFSIWKELKTAKTWKEVEQKVWGFLADCNDN